VREIEIEDRPFDFPDPLALFDGHEYAKAPTLSRRASRMIRELPDFEHLRGHRVIVVWRAGKSKKLGQCEKAEGLLQLFAGRNVPFVITIYYDMCRAVGLSDYQMDALLDHELRHCGFGEQGEPVIIRHDVEEFVGTVQRYGLWFEDVRRFAEVCARVAG